MNNKETIIKKNLLKILVLGQLLILLVSTNVFANGAKEGGSETNSEEITVLQACTTTAEGSIYTDILYELSKYCSEESNGALKIDVFPNSQMGSQTEVIEQAQAGAPVIGIAAITLMADYGAPELSIFGGPYLFESWDDVKAVVKSDWFTEQEKLLEQNGLMLTSASMEAGTRQTLSKYEMKTLADYVGKKIRTPSSNSNVKAYEALGSAATPMNLGEVYTALQTGIIDGEDNGLATMVSEKHYEVAKNLILDNHVYDAQCMMIGKSVFDSLSAEHQQILLESSEKAAEWFNRAAQKANNEAIQVMVDGGVKVIEITDYTEFKEAAASYYTDPAFASDWSDGLYDRVSSIFED